jgi:hypothetical protein
VDKGAGSAAYDPAKHLFYVVASGDEAKLDYSMISVFDTSSR